MTQPAEVIAHWINTVNEEGKRLTKWEEDFMESITDQFELRGSISDAQQDKLETIYAEKT